ncbi:hypothetical protein HYPSUDRAFT_622805 [Hypholoma sublateritium FD-334 SS-4]|uniref:Uncharacterized protein n=1 Tax=Hypholoma sublateritium (strain FD-334 SS-4) TaxID=945553 RepID=A0A0D2QB08_HYPSF|nr:hypothetical protein HYPSUDRAFT_622805 [Hypholoma sublateritium FD-334 SS-4]
MALFSFGNTRHFIDQVAIGRPQEAIQGRWSCRDLKQVARDRCRTMHCCYKAERPGSKMFAKCYSCLQQVNKYYFKEHMVTVVAGLADADKGRTKAPPDATQEVVGPSSKISSRRQERDYVSFCVGLGPQSNPDRIFQEFSLAAKYLQAPRIGIGERQRMNTSALIAGYPKRA